MSIPGFEDDRFEIGAADYFVSRGGTGPPLLLLHGFPETHLCWRHLAPALSQGHHVVVPDIRGYGDSLAPPGGEHGEGYSKREVAAELVELMARCGHDRFAIVGHDRGARIAFRLAMDHPQSVTRVVMLNVVTTLDQFERMGAGPSLGYWPWFLLAQPAPFPERMLAADPDSLLEHVFTTWASRPAAIGRAERVAYRRAMTRQTIAAMCADYRASFHLDRYHDADDRAAGRRIVAPMLVVKGADETQLDDARDIWASWADDLTVQTVPGGHFIPEESPEDLAGVLSAFLGPGLDPRQ